MNEKLALVCGSVVSTSDLWPQMVSSTSLRESILFYELLPCVAFSRFHPLWPCIGSLLSGTYTLLAGGYHSVCQQLQTLVVITPLVHSGLKVPWWCLLYSLDSRNTIRQWVPSYVDDRYKVHQEYTIWCQWRVPNPSDLNISPYLLQSFFRVWVVAVSSDTMCMSFLAVSQNRADDKCSCREEGPF